MIKRFLFSVGVTLAVMGFITECWWEVVVGDMGNFYFVLQTGLLLMILSKVWEN